MHLKGWAIQKKRSPISWLTPPYGYQEQEMVQAKPGSRSPILNLWEAGAQVLGPSSFALLGALVGSQIGIRDTGRQPVLQYVLLAA